MRTATGPGPAWLGASTGSGLSRRSDRNTGKRPDGLLVDGLTADVWGAGGTHATCARGGTRINPRDAQLPVSLSSFLIPAASQFRMSVWYGIDFCVAILRSAWI